jgi:hypothetical protein
MKIIELKIDPLVQAAAIRNQEMYFRRGIANADELVFWILIDIWYGSGNAKIEVHGEIRVISSNIDWIPCKSSLEKLFSTITPEPSLRGDNSMRSEFLLGVFCRDITLKARGEIVVIKGDTLQSAFSDDENYLNQLAFRL